MVRYLLFRSKLPRKQVYTYLLGTTHLLYTYRYKTLHSHTHTQITITNCHQHLNLLIPHKATEDH